MTVTEADPKLERLLEFVRENRGFDFTGYKRASLTRRIRRRMQDVSIDDVSEYQDYLQAHPDEFTQLFNTILINVTSFFRDPDSWRYLADEVLPRIREKKNRSDQLRVWSVGCASGEEAYTLAIVLAESLGIGELKRRAKIYATDVDEEALAIARAGVYSSKEVEPIPEELVAKYLEPAGEDFAFRKELRRSVIFGRHDLVHDAPISRVDLIVCRNTVIYFNADAQSRIYNAFHFALKPDGYLFLGRAEMLLTRGDLFVAADGKHRLYARVGRQDETEDSRGPRRAAPNTQETTGHLRAGVFESATTAQIVVDSGGAVAGVNGLARSLFELGDDEIGRFFYELEVSYKPLELRSRIDRALSDRRPSVEHAVPWTSPRGDQLFLDVEVVPIFRREEHLGTMVVFIDVTHAYATSNQLERSRRELETAYEEIQSTVEELETTNEELQSTNEELETTNEELQSTNEELETMNEELQSTNEELATVNTELNERTAQLNQSNSFLDSVLESMRAGVVVLDPELSVQTWNLLAEEMWGLTAAEVEGKNLFALDFGLPVEELRQAIRDCMSGEHEFVETTHDAVNRRGRTIRCKVVCSQMNDQQGAGQGVILLIEEIPA